jgi:iron complex transport system substrate-binding protein
MKGVKGMNFKLFFKHILIFVFMALVLSGCSFDNRQDTNTNKITVTDALGRTVAVDAVADRVVAIGPGALRLYCYFNTDEGLVGIEQIDKDDSTGKPYMLANPSFKDLPVIGQGGPNNSPDPEKIIGVKPDVIFSTYAPDSASVDKLQAKTGIPVIALSYGKASVFDPEIYNSIRIIGEIIGKEERARQIVDYMENCRQDLNARTKGIQDGIKPSIYIGALGMKGTHGIESTYGAYSLFDAINAKNVVDETGRIGSVMIDKEKLIDWNPDIIFIDAGGWEIVRQDYNKNREFYTVLSAFKNGEVYLQLPFNYYHTNIDTAMTNAYYMGKVMFPEQFEDVDAEEKADQIYKFLLGKELYHQMKKDFGGFKRITFEGNED